MSVEYNTTDITTLIATNQYYIPPTEEYSKSNLSSISIDILNKRLVTEQKKVDFINLLSKHIKNVVSAIFTPFPYQIKSEQYRLDAYMMMKVYNKDSKYIRVCRKYS